MGMYALLSEAGGPRRRLCWFLYWKAPKLVLMHFFFIIPPFGPRVNKWMCDTNYNGVGTAFGTSCQRAVAAVQVSRGLFYAGYSCFTIHAARAFRDCHPDNDPEKNAAADPQSDT